jgi:hypothetical protein
MPVFSSGELNRKPPKLDSEAPHYLQSTSRGANRALQIIRPVFKFNDAVQLGSKHILNQTGAEASSPRRRHGWSEDSRLFGHPCFATRSGGVSAGKETQG